MITQDFSFQTDTEALSAFRVIAESGDMPTCLLLHGAGESNKERLKPIAGEFARLGISSIGFDYSGCGSSSANSISSIGKRTYEASKAIGLLDPNQPIILCGFSMSGQVIINLLQRYTNISHIILCAPGLYDIRALCVPFGSEFTDILREPESWKNNNTKEILREFTGNILIVMGSLDTVIPTEIPEIIMNHATRAKKKEIHVIEGAPHMLAGWTQEYSHNARYLGNLIGEFLR